MNRFFQPIVFYCCFIQYVSAQTTVAGRRELFDSDWRFCLGDSVAAADKNFNDNSWRKLDLPHDWSIEGVVNPDNPAKGPGGYFPAGIGWYRKTFPVPAEWKGKVVSIYFEGVYMNAEVFINGKSLGVRPYGYSSFFLDLSPYLEFGKDNVLAVRVDNSQQINSRWYSGSGIYRHVWMMVTDPVHIAQFGVSITTPAVSAKQALVQIRTIVKNESSVDQRVVLRTKVLGAGSQKAGSREAGGNWAEGGQTGGNRAGGTVAEGARTEIAIAAHSEKEIVRHIVIKGPSLWSPDNPYLYQALCQLYRKNVILDETAADFGVRSIQFSAEHGFRLNGKTVKISGACVHHDNGCLGSKAFDRAEERKIGLLRAAGFNAVRTSHNPPSEAFLNACDRVGLLVMDESFDCWKTGKNPNDYASYFDKWWKTDLQTMIRRDRNHPSVVMWSIGNEIAERDKPEAIETAKMLYSEIKTMDATRPVTSAVVNYNKWEHLDSLMAVLDIAGYNYHLNSALSDHQRVPGRIILQTESYPRDAFANWKTVQDNNFVIGDFVWSGMDYLGEAGIGRTYYSGETPGENWENDMFPWHGSYCGDIDLIGYRKPISHYRNILYNNTEKLYMAVREPNPEPVKIKETWWSVWPGWESWNWQGFEGKKLQVEIYSRYPKVRLYLNDKLIGEENTSREQEFKAVFLVAYAAGVLKVVGIENGKEAESRVLRTAGNAAKIKLTADKNELVANGQDLSFITIDITDKDGNVQPNAADLLNFKIEGAGTIAGVANADMKDCDSYVASSRRAWHGKALVVVKSSHEAGDIRLTVTANGLESNSIIIKTTQANQ